MNIFKSGSWWPWFWANTLALDFGFGFLAVVSQLVDLLGAHGPTALGLAAHISAIFVGGAVLGFLQQRVLALSPAEKKRWTLVTPLVYTVSFIAGEIAGGLLFSLAIAMALFGLLSGLWQSVVLRNYTDNAGRWIVISALGFAAGGLVASALLFSVYRLLGPAFFEIPAVLAQALIGAVCGAVAGYTTGLGLKKLLRNSKESST